MAFKVGDIVIVVADRGRTFSEGDRVEIIRILPLSTGTCNHLCIRLSDNKEHYMFAYELREEEFMDVVKRILSE